MKALGLVALAACNFQATAVLVDAADASADGSADAAIDASAPDTAIVTDARSCFGVGLVKACLVTQPVGGANLPVVSPLDTSRDASCDQIVEQQRGPSLCVITGINVTVTGALVATGQRPLVVIATDSIVVTGAGTIDVSSVGGPVGRRGAGGNATECTRSDKGRNDAGGAGGGAGGSFGTIGGKGGTGDLNNSNPPNQPASGGNPGSAQPAPAVFHGGCGGAGGGEGRDSDQRNIGGPPGDGGGAVYLIAGNRITIDGDVFASGAGGRGTVGSAGFQEGGGGGGSGGMIVLDAPMLQVQGRVVANGGAGAGGGGSVGGAPGGDGTTLAWDQSALAGLGDQEPPPNGPAGNGAPGTAAGRTDNLDGAGARLGAGGGAGGLGLIWTYGALNGGGMMSPAPIQR